MARAEDRGLDAVIRPSPLTLGKLARLERIKSPLLAANFDSLAADIEATWAVSVDADEFYKAVSSDSVAKSAEAWIDAIGKDEYKAQFDELVKGLVDFGVLMPRPDEDAKKNDSATAG